jgi:glycosyltransferase involved in cell wall biosynthesis
LTPAPRVAVITPCYDDGPLLKEAVASVREAEPVDLVVVDDGSTDAGTLAVLEELGRRGTRVVRRENGGLAEARATGLAATSAPFVYPLDADDLLEPGALAAMADALERHPDAAVAWGDYELFGDGKGSYRSPNRWLPWTLTYVNPYPVCSLFRREPLERAGDWRGAPGARGVGAHGYEDWDLWLRLVSLGVGGVRVDRAVYRRRLHGSGRLLVSARRNHRALYAELVERNATVFAMRDQLRRRERPSAWKRAVYPVLFGPRKYVPFRVEAFLQRTMMRLGTGLPG